MSASPSSTPSPSPRVSRPRASSRSARSTRPSCSGPTIRSCMTSRSRTCRCASRSIAPGLVGADGATHAGVLRPRLSLCLPNLVVMARGGRGRVEAHGRHRGRDTTTGRSPLRYPRGEGVGVEMPARGEALEIGKGRVVREGIADRAALAGNAALRMPEGGRGSGQLAAFRRRSPMRASPSRSTSS